MLLHIKLQSQNIVTISDIHSQHECGNDTILLVKDLM
jgi:hypothetical protein